MRVLVTGGAGFIGSHVVDAYLGQGHDVLAIDNLSHGSQDNLQCTADFERLDICDSVEIHRVLKTFQPDVINHHAAQVDARHSVEDPLGDERTNVSGTVNLLQAAAKAGVRAFIFASSGGAIYGEQEDAADEEAPKAPLSPYGAAKSAAEAYLFVFSRTFDLPAVALRYSNVYGPRQGRSGEAGVVPIFIQRMVARTQARIYGDGEQTRDFVYVGDVARANLLAIEYLLRERPTPMTVDGLAFNVSSGVAISVNDLYSRLARIVGYSKPPVYENPRLGDIRHSVLSPAKAVRVLDFESQIPLDEGLQTTVKWFKEQLPRDPRRG